MKSWDDILRLEKSKDYYKELENFLEKEYATKKIFPPKELIFNAFEKTSLDKIKVVILGQDPYHGEGQAQGFSFSTPSNIKNPPSMQNILKEIKDDTSVDSICLDGDLTSWAQQGVLLLNAILTVEEAKPKSHEKKGWENFTDNIIKYISSSCEDIVFILWGAPAIKKSKLIDETKHHILTAPHPSPLSSYRGFFGCKHFSKTNEILKQKGKEQIQW
ncbi:uracil-DNA glycosylase [Halarcobacter bivalviorum]|uniref:Uracil-DNA glycosylase n=1 Tax=Halarcobacter bivalviorum TaxID=663364 RepID=A0AAX2A795_9BACT|nr:uracil-DNA glycosylase [Halarcobacter bivalviorum]AXH13554.1 uracil-DNA glycosylase, family 1 [Halarcobacter bivalviorum]RXK09840.1 uracil-DNA glycosylase [Halarcobacter bivalviorum]